MVEALNWSHMTKNSWRLKLLSMEKLKKSGVTLGKVENVNHLRVELLFGSSCRAQAKCFVY